MAYPIIHLKGKSKSTILNFLKQGKLFKTVKNDIFQLSISYT